MRGSMPSRRTLRSSPSATIITATRRAETLARLQAHDIPIYRTDQMGDVTVHLS
ncbi:MAG: hypothetical protein ACLUNO_06410 [Oscillospiraceae bacterium]